MKECPSCAKQIPETAGFCEHCGHNLKLTAGVAKRPLTRIPVVVTTCLLGLAAFGRWPYGFYQLLRLITCGTAAYLAFAMYHEQKRGWMWTTVVLALLFNPLLPIRLSRAEWQPIDFVVAIVFGVFLLGHRQR